MPTELIPSPDFLAGLHEAICDLIRLIDQPAPDDLRHSVVVVWAKIVSLLLTSSPAAVSSWSETLSLPNSIARLQSLAVEGAPLSEALTSAAKQEELVNYVTAQLEQWREARDTLAICLQWAESVGPAATEREALDASLPPDTRQTESASQEVRTVGDLLNVFTYGSGETINGREMMGFAGTDYEGCKAADA